MGKYNSEILQTVFLLIILISLILIVKQLITKFTFIRSIDINRRKIILNLSYLILYLIAAPIIAAIWGVELRQFVIFISSILAVLGVGFFAQWSLLSNLTASVILFFSHPLRIGDRIRVLDKDFNWVGRVTNITGFYLFMKTDAGENITLPNSLVVQKGIQILEDEEINNISDEL
ncbi:MAG: mechanosensitive ion channel family protein [Flavobacteriaceae bacterium]|nr:mechanosensitive ion channel family protein [Flavobacteriaceae bacterium]